ncbi:hypothetical protein RhiJN_02308 [Ceratobasidium sp. AG-Ba]|nr:hypothetical protein RhiJN_02308 [Ceratobasidium sp. AG-Ba]QRW03239.1 hypothetical protein RhiLY_02238 [Ceratobasidium sp. AG-Ba]
MHLSIPSIFSFYLGVLATTAFAEVITTRGGNFKLFTADSPELPIKPTGNLTLYYGDFDPKTRSQLRLVSQKSGPAVGFQLYNGALATSSPPPNIPGGRIYFAQAPDGNSLVNVRDALGTIYGPYGLKDDKFLVVNEVLEGTWWLCTDNKDKVPILAYQAAPSRGCKPTYLALFE